MHSGVRAVTRGAARRIWGLLLMMGLGAVSGGNAVAGTAVTGDAACAPLLDVEKRYLNSEQSVRLCDAYRGQVLLIVNTASKCAFTPQYDGLEALHARLADRGFQVLGFPSNDFGGQEPGSEAQVQEFCRLTYSVKFPMFEKSQVRRDNAEPFYRALGDLAGEYPRWNFHKYLIDREGRLVGSFPSRVRPDDAVLLKAIEAAL